MSYYRVFATARWSLDALGLVLFSLAMSLLEPGAVPLTLNDCLWTPTCTRSASQAWTSSAQPKANEGSKSPLGVEEPRGWSRQAARRAAPMAMLPYSLTVPWFAKEGPPTTSPPSVPGIATRCALASPTGSPPCAMPVCSRRFPRHRPMSRNIKNRSCSSRTAFRRWLDTRQEVQDSNLAHGEYTSADAKMLLWNPPETSTLPLYRSVAV